MTRQAFAAMAAGGPVLLDGATGSNLRAAGMPVGVCAELWALEHPEIVKELQQAYVAAGSQIIYAPTFSANRISLSMHGLQERIAELNRELLALSREAANGRAYVAGDVTTTGKMLEPRGEISYQDLYHVYQEQIEILAASGADLLVAETMLDVEETLVVLDAAQSVCDLPVMCTLTLQADGSAMYGGDAVEMVETLQEMGAVAVGLNCSVGPDQLEAVVSSMKRVAKVPVIAKPNAGMPEIDELGNAHYNMPPEHFAASMKRLTECGAGLVGGCCGTTPEYIALLAQALGKNCGLK